MKNKDKQFKKFQTLDEAWRNQMMSATDEEVHKKIIECTMKNIALEEAKELDPDLMRIKEEKKTAEEPYKEGKKENNIQAEFLVECLRSRGRDVPDAADFADPKTIIANMRKNGTTVEAKA